MRMPTKEERELEKILDKADKEGWIENKIVKDEVFGFSYKLNVAPKKDAPEWVKKAWERLEEIESKFNEEGRPIY